MKWGPSPISLNPTCHACYARKINRGLNCYGLLLRNAAGVRAYLRYGAKKYALNGDCVVKMMMTL